MGVEVVPPTPTIRPGRLCPLIALERVRVVLLIFLSAEFLYAVVNPEKFSYPPENDEKVYAGPSDACALKASPVQLEGVPGSRTLVDGDEAHGAALHVDFAEVQTVL